MPKGWRKPNPLIRGGKFPEKPIILKTAPPFSFRPPTPPKISLLHTASPPHQIPHVHVSLPPRTSIASHKYPLLRNRQTPQKQTQKHFTSKQVSVPIVHAAQQGVTPINPWLLHLQKLGLELKCPLCLNFLRRPLLLPCDHIFCSSCLPKTAQYGAECPLCNARYGKQDLRFIPFVENMATIYRSLDSALSSSKLQSTVLDTGSLEQCHTSIITACNNKMNRVAVKTAGEGNSSSGQSGSLPTSSELGCIPPNCSTDNVAFKNNMLDKCSMPNDVKDGKYEISSIGENRGSVEGYGTSPPFRSQIRTRGLQGCGMVEVDLNQVDQLSTGSPPSFSDVKDSENDSNDQGSDDNPLNYQAVKSVKGSIDGKKRQETCDGSASVMEEGRLTGPKRHKKLNYGPLDMSIQNVGCSHLEKSVATCSNALSPALLDNSSVVKNVCGFCQSSKISEDSGPMLHFVNGKIIGGDNVLPSNAIHVHNLCIEWAPQVYFVGESVKNLKVELARGAKIKCSKCGLKGAALGCYLKSCRKSYHAPCAMGIPNCRWDYENFLMLCPVHASIKFPHEKSKSEKHNLKDCPVHMPIAPQQSNFWVGSSSGANQWVFCGSALTSEDKFLLVKFGNLIGVPVTKFWKPSVTHVVAATDAKGACTRTLKVLMAILNGRWVVTIDWIKACMESMHPVDEECYEVSLDNHGCRDGPKCGRLSTLNKAPKLFNSLNFYFSGDFLSGYKEDLQNLVTAAGGTILEGEELVEQIHGDRDSSRTLIVYNLDPPQGCKLGEEVSIIWQRANEAADLAAKIGSQVIGHTWLLESISAYKLQPFVN